MRTWSGISAVLLLFATSVFAASRRGSLPSSSVSSSTSSSTNSPAVTTYPRVIRYSGKLPAEANKVLGVTFALYDTQTGGRPLWIETQNVTTDANGAYTAVLGESSLEGLPIDLFSSNQARWLGVTINNNSEQPRILLVSVPYALKAGDAETLGGFTAAQIAAMAQPRILSTVTPAAGPTPAAITVSRPGMPGRGVDSGATPSTLRGSFFLNGSQVVIEAYDDGAKAPLQLLLNPQGGNVGINTTSPNSPLSVAGVVESTSGGFKFPDGTSQATAAAVKSFNGRTGAVAPAASDYSFSQLSGTLADAQLTGSYTQALTLSNVSNAITGTFSGNGALLVGVLPAAGSTNYIQNGSTTQTSANLNIDGTAKANVVNSATTYQIAGTPVITTSTSEEQLFIGPGTGASLTPTFGFGDTFTGYNAGFSNTTGSGNTFNGHNAGFSNTLMGSNTFIGDSAGYSNVLGEYNTFEGFVAGRKNSSGVRNVFIGANAGFNNTAESYNTYVGADAGEQHDTSGAGDNNTFLGSYAGSADGSAGLVSGGNNTYVGAYTGANVTGSANVYVGYNLGHFGSKTVTNESNTMRLGNPATDGTGITNTYIAGVSGVTITGGVAVVVDSSGHIGIASSSSRRFKDNIRPMGDVTDGLFKLRPVTFYYKTSIDPTAPRLLQYGLVAEELAQVYPELVTYDAEGRPNAIKYQYLTPMLLNEVQKQHAVIISQQQQVSEQQEKIDELEKRVERLERLLSDRIH